MGDILVNLTGTRHPNLMVGFETADDAGVYRINDELALVATADFITPVVDDPRVFGRVAAANSLSDVYAMGGRPLMAVNLCGYPHQEVPAAVLGEILAGAAETCDEAGCAVAGGHTVRDTEIKFGLSVTGKVHPDRVLRNTGARAGDRLVLTKPLGTGALVAAARANRLAEDHEDYAALVTCMTGLNACGMLLADLGATACTDVTGFGLSGHGLEMARASDQTLIIDTAALPLLPRAAEWCADGFTCGGTKSNAGWTAGSVDIDAGVETDLVGVLHDPQTSGGLLISVPEKRCVPLQAALLDAGALCAEVIGEVQLRHPRAPWLRFC